MRIEHIEFATVNKALKKINDLHIGRFVLNIAIDDAGVVVFFRFESYPDYTHFCKKVGRTPIPVYEYF